MEPNDNDLHGAIPISSNAIGGGTAPAPTKPRWDPKGKRNMLIIVGVVGTALLLLVLLFAGGRNQEEKKASSIVQAPSEQPVGAGMLSQADRDALKAQENARIGAALSGGQSAVGAQVGAGATSVQISAPQQASAPLTQQGEVRLDQHAQQSQPQQQASQAAPQQPPGPSEAKTKGLESQMLRMMTAWGMGSDSGTQRGSSMYVREVKSGNAAAGNQSAQQGNSSGAIQRPANDLMVVKAYGEMYAAEMISATDSDTPGKLRARITSGPLTGAVLIGAAKRIGDQGFQVDFTSASFNGHAIKVTAYAVDSEEPGDLVRGDYDGRYMQRYVFPVVSEGVKAYAGARAQVGTTVIAIPVPGASGVVTGGQQTPPPTAEQARNAMYSSGANQVSRALATGPQDGHLTLAARTQIGIVFEESIYQSDISGQARQTGK
ncbi:DotG/IcmE/VirB10 family protein [Massilia orientalis]|uniref:DotG/IcmE/VirB10 family protein n=1 Tax=Massilia orientalis TaxID=3050128 RepID=A0ACC7MF53_9BURK|nr:DotG/IcmE/VirB10 family protein [Massilia sp. YIM B02787]